MLEKKYLITSILLVLTALLLTWLYRPYAYQNNISDFGFADTIGSLVSVIGFCFFVWGVKEYSDKEKNKQIIIATLLYSAVWELFGFLRIYGTFDWKDIVAAIISGIITFLLKEIIEKNK